MRGTYTARVGFQVRVLTLGQLADLWSMVMSLLPEVNRGWASFKRRGQATDQDYVFADADELAQTRFGFRPGELRLQSIHVANADLSIDIHGGRTNLFRGILFALPTGLEVEITGSKEAEVLKVRKAIEQWGGQNFGTTRSALRLKLGVLAAGIIGAWAGGELLELSAGKAFLIMVLWIYVFFMTCLFQGWIPARFRWSTELRIIDGEGPKRGGPGGGTPAAPAPAPDPGTTADRVGKPSLETT